MEAPATFFFLSSALQGYAAYMLLRGPAQTRLARGSLALLFACNTLLTLNGMLDRAGVVLFDGASTEVDFVTDGLLVVAAEACAASITGGRFHPIIWPVAAFLSVAPVTVHLATTADAGVFIFYAYAFVAVRLAAATLRAGPSSPRFGWGLWLLAAFMPRITEFLAEYALSELRHAPSLTWLTHGPAFLLMATGVALAGWVASRERDRLGRAALGASLACGALVALTAILQAKGDTFLVFFTLSILRPLGVLAGVHESDLLGARLEKPRVLRHVAVAAGAGAVFTLGIFLAPLVLASPGAASVLAIASALTVVALPAAIHLADRAFPLEAPATEPDPAPGPAPEDVAFRKDAASRVEALPAPLARALASLRREERVLLSLLGMEKGVRRESSYAGISLATHVPARQVGEVIKDINGQAPGKPWIGTLRAPDHTRHAYLTAAGIEAAQRIVREKGLPQDPSTLRALLGQSFYRSAGGSPPDSTEG